LRDETRAYRRDPVHELWMFRGLLGETQFYGPLRGLPPPFPAAPPPAAHAVAHEFLRDAAR
jgi:hypothetical protein